MTESIASLSTLCKTSSSSEISPKSYTRLEVMYGRVDSFRFEDDAIPRRTRGVAGRDQENVFIFSKLYAISCSKSLLYKCSHKLFLVVFVHQND